MNFVRRNTCPTCGSVRSDDGCPVCKHEIRKIIEDIDRSTERFCGLGDHPRRRAEHIET